MRFSPPPSRACARFSSSWRMISCMVLSPKLYAAGLSRPRRIHAIAFNNLPAAAAGVIDPSATASRTAASSRLTAGCW